ncbi:hypothetical protein V6N12_030030 [Hibiscus sabdariffa]|uniref:Uncharacterized protein n=1 Tax=Hibiscus sabdariffa TaxID=183260 RepID=A0ABR2CJ57_9ROSI
MAMQTYNSRELTMIVHGIWKIEAKTPIVTTVDGQGCSKDRHVQDVNDNTQRNIDASMEMDDGHNIVDGLDIVSELDKAKAIEIDRSKGDHHEGGNIQWRENVAHAQPGVTRTMFDLVTSRSTIING